MRSVAAALVVVIACGGGADELGDLAARTCEELAAPDITLQESSVVLFAATAEAIDMGYTEDELGEALRSECPGSVIVGGGG